MKVSILLVCFLCLKCLCSFGQDYKQPQFQLEQIYERDQKYRNAIPKNYRVNSPKMRELIKTIMAQDSINLPIVTQILDTYGWISKDKIGSKANSAIFLVIQHADLKTQEKYLHKLRKAVLEGKAQLAELAMLEDRVALKQGKKQLYGSQIEQDSITGKFYVAPLEDPQNVDKRRAKMGLQPLYDYVKEWDIIWEPQIQHSPNDTEDEISQKLSGRSDEKIDFTKIELPNVDFVFNPIYIGNYKLVGFTLTINPAHFTTYIISSINGKPINVGSYLYDYKSKSFIVRVEGVTNEEELYPSSMIIDGKGFYFQSYTKWYNFKKLSDNYE